MNDLEESGSEEGDSTWENIEDEEGEIRKDKVDGSLKSHHGEYSKSR